MNVRSAMPRFLMLAGLALGVAGQTAQAAAPTGLGDPGALESLVIETGRDVDGGFSLAGRDASQQLLVTGKYASGQLRDLTRQARYETTPADIVSVSPSGLVTPLAEGKATVRAEVAGAEATLAVTVTNIVVDVPVNFPNQVVPLLTKFGCNSGGCHGKADGQNGFKLSLLGFEPEEDYEHLVKEARGRRLSPAAPDYSLLLRKVAGGLPHGGGTRIEADSPYYRVLRRWIEQGTPFGRENDPVVTRIEVFPKERLLGRNAHQQIIVIAHHSDGSTRDVTRLTQLEANQPDMAEVSLTGLVSTKDLPGSVAVMTRYQSHVDVYRGTVPLGAPMNDMPGTKNYVDELAFARLKMLGLPPSAPCDDATFIRRATIDIAGRLPTAAEAREFSADADPDKHEKLIDRLLASDDYAYYFANKWSSVLRNRRNSANDDVKPTMAFHQWIFEGLKSNKPYDQFAREILTVKGEEGKDPAVVWYRELKEPSAMLEDAAQLFLGQRLQCARCHHHPFEKWSQEDYYGFAAFFSQVEVAAAKPAKKAAKNTPEEPATPAKVTVKSAAPKATNVKTGLDVKPTGLGGAPLDVSAGDDARVKLAEWMSEKDNPFFAHTLVNRYWKHFFGRGLVDPEDDLRITNPPTNPELLDALARDFVDGKFDTKNLIRTICTSRVYRLSAIPNEYNAEDRQNFSRYVPKRLNAEVLLDAVDSVTLAKTTFKGMPDGTRAVHLPDNLFDSYFLSVFGRPDSASPCECERSTDASLAQCLHMFNSTEVLGKVSGARAAQLAADKRPHSERLRDLYLAALAREPSPEETAALVEHIEKKADNVKGAYEDIIWAVINSKEFMFNH
jgi:hypothetical protein